MSKKVVDVMSSDAIKLPSYAPVMEAAKQMSSAGIGAVIVEDDGASVTGIVTDRDIAVRVVAQGLDPSRTKLGEVCSRDLVTISPEDEIDTAIACMRDRAIRRLLVVDSDSRTVGVLSLGDLALERDASSVLGQISAAPPSL